MTAPTMDKLGEQLIAAGLLDAEGLSRGLALQRERGGFLLDVLLEVQLLDERKVLRFIAERSGAQFVTADKLKLANVTPQLIDKLPVRVAERLLVIPLGYEPESRTLRVAVAEIDPALLEQVKIAAQVEKVLPIIATRAALRAGIKRFYYGDTYAFATLQEGVAKGVVQARDRETVLARGGADRLPLSPPSPRPRTKSQEFAAPRRDGTQVMFVPMTSSAVAPVGAPLPLNALPTHSSNTPVSAPPRQPRRLMSLADTEEPTESGKPRESTLMMFVPPEVRAMKIVEAPPGPAPALLPIPLMNVREAAPAPSAPPDLEESTLIVPADAEPPSEPRLPGNEPPRPARAPESDGGVELLAESSSAAPEVAAQKPAAAPRPESTRMMFMPVEAPPKNQSATEPTRMGLPPSADEPGQRAPEQPPAEEPETTDNQPIGAVPREMHLALAREVDRLRRENELLKISRELHRHIAHEREIGALLQRVLAYAFDMLPADEGLLFIIDGTSGDVTQRFVRTRKEEGAEVVFSTTLLSEVLETRKGVLTGDAMMDARFSGASSVQDGNLRSAIGVPFVVGGQVRGLIFLGTVDSVDVFTEPDLDVLLAIAAEAEIAIERAERDQRIEDNLLTRAHLSRFFSPALVEQASIGQINPFLPSSHEVTVLFARVRGFAQAANAYSPEQVMATLSEHFDAMMDIVFMHGGVCDKFIGDGLMALWNVPVAKSGSASRALRAGLEMVARVEEMNVARKEQGLSALHISVALHTGPVVFGEIGAARRQEFTAIGDTVDAAARLCDQVGPAQVVATESTLKSAGDSFETSEVARTEKRSRWPFGAGAKPEEIPARTVITERE